MDPHYAYEEEIGRLRSQLATAQNELNSFVHTVSHDLGAPLRAVTSFSGLLKGKYAGKLDEKGELYLSFVMEGGHKAQAMLSGLLQYSRLETQTKPMGPVDLHDLLSQCHADLRDKIAAANAALHIGALPTVIADSAQYYQLFMALLDNALTYRKADGGPSHIYISVEDLDTFWKFKIDDNGIGITPANQDRVFQIFKRLHSDEQYPGSGIGLALAKKIAERHGGTIGMATSPYGGAQCWFTLPKPLTESLEHPVLRRNAS